MFRNANNRATALIFALAAGVGTALAFLAPVSPNKPKIVPAPSVQPPQQQAEGATPARPTPAAYAPIPMRDRLALGSAKFPAAPAFVERANGVYEASTPRYTSLLSSENGLRYFPSAGAGQSSELRVQLKSVYHGASPIFDRGADSAGDSEIAEARGAGGLSYARSPSFVESYEPRGDGIEQSFTLDSKPAGDGDLVFSLDMDAKNLTPLPARAGRNGGILFAARDGTVAVRYGQVMVRDAGNRSLVVEPLLDAASNAIRFAVPKLWMDSAKYPVVIDPLVGSDFAISDPTNTTPHVSQPTVCAGTNNYLVAWTDYTAGANLPQILGSIVTQAGVASTPFAISSSVAVPAAWRFQRIECAFDGANWLVVWNDGQSAGPGIRGAIVGSTGTLLGGTDFLISATTGNVIADPLATFNGTNYVVAWTDTPTGLSGGSQVFFTFVNSSGVAAQAQVVKSNFAVISQALEYLTAQRPNGDTLLIYEELNEVPTLHRSIRIQTSGVVLDPGGTALFKEALVQNDGSAGYGRPIGAVFNTTANEWQILSSYDQTLDSAIFLHHLSLTGTVTPPTGVFAEMGVGPIGVTQLDAWAPAFAGASEWLFLRNERVNNTVYHVLGKRVTFSGVDLDPIPFQIDSATRGIISNGVASQAGNLFLVAWLDGRNAPTQPASQITIAAALVDASAVGSSGPPLVAVASASPTTGEAGVTVSFNSALSTGSYDSLAWGFGDGTTSTLVSPSKTYKANGTYIAELVLTKGAYSVFDTVVITVGTGGPSGAPTTLGVPLQNTPPIVTGLFISSVSIKLDFFNLSNDQATVAGFCDITSLNGAVTGTIAQVALGGKTFAFNLDAKGTFKSAAGAAPAINFVISPTTGAFIFQVAAADLRGELANLGMVNDSIPTNISVPLPLTIGVDKLISQANVGTLYHAKKNVNGAANYGFLGVGNEISGAFLISSFTAAEVSAKAHTFTIKGQLVKPGVFKPDVNGNFKVYLGDYQATIPGGAILNKSGILTYTAKITSGIKKFTLNTASGVFSIQLLNVTQDSAQGGTGLPLAKSGTDIVKVDMNLSFLFDLSDNTKLSAGRYMYIGRTNAATKSWKLR